jgi:hypothetical protein
VLSDGFRDTPADQTDFWHGLDNSKYLANFLPNKQVRKNKLEGEGAAHEAKGDALQLKGDAKNAIKDGVNKVADAANKKL